MTEPESSAIAASVAELVIRYGFDLNGYPLDRWIEQWLMQYPPAWLYSAVIEALYQGRYKAISVWQILELWRRRGRPVQHFNRDFARIISGRSIPLLFSETMSPAMLLPEPVMAATEAAIDQSAKQNGYFATPQTQGAAMRFSALEPEGGSPIFTAKPAALGELWMPGPQNMPCETDPFGQPPAIQPFKPSVEFQLHLPSPQKNRPIAPPPIQQFVPISQPPEIHTKLKAMVQAILRSNAEAAAQAIQAAKQQPQPNATETSEGTEAEITFQAEPSLNSDQSTLDQTDS